MFHDSDGMESPKRILGLEGGGTKTTWVLLAGDGSVLRNGVLPASNLRLITDEALAQLFSVLPREATHAGVFLAGCATDEDRTRLRGLVEKAWPQAQIAIGSDRDSGLATAFRDGDGIAVIAGTGTAVHGRKDGRIEKAGGWGQLLGDRGGGYDLARRGLRLVLTHFDLNQQITPLAEEILQTPRAQSPAGSGRMGHAGRQNERRATRAFAIFHAAKMGELANARHGGGRRGYPGAIHEGRGRTPRFSRGLPFALLGGLFTHHEEYAALYRYRLSILLPKATVEVCAESGATGAAWLAERAINPPPETESLVVEDAGALAVAATEQSNPRSAALEDRTTGELVDLFVTEESKVAEALAVRRAELMAAVDLVSASLRAAGRLFYVGAGTSGRLGVLDEAKYHPPSALLRNWCKVSSPVAHRPCIVRSKARRINPEARRSGHGRAWGCARATLFASGTSPRAGAPLSSSGRCPAAGNSARGPLLTCNPARVATGWDVEIDLPTGPEIVTGSTRLKAGTATNVVLNLLSTCAMIRLGRVRGNSMVDLHISNAKLRDRGVRLISRELQIGYEEARERLEKAGWNVRAALS